MAAWSGGPPQRWPQGFTLVEMVVAISLVGLLTAWVAPLIQLPMQALHAARSRSVQHTQWAQARSAVQADVHRAVPGSMSVTHSHGVAILEMQLEAPSNLATTNVYVANVVSSNEPEPATPPPPGAPTAAGERVRWRCQMGPKDRTDDTQAVKVPSGLWRDRGQTPHAPHPSEPVLATVRRCAWQLGPATGEGVQQRRLTLFVQLPQQHRVFASASTGPAAATDTDLWATATWSVPAW